jgi:hypothetical protein
MGSRAFISRCLAVTEEAGDGAYHRGNEDHASGTCVRALSVRLTQEEVAYLEEPYVPHPIVGYH